MANVSEWLIIGRGIIGLSVLFATQNYLDTSLLGSCDLSYIHWSYLSIRCGLNVQPKIEVLFSLFSLEPILMF